LLEIFKEYVEMYNVRSDGSLDGEGNSVDASTSGTSTQPLKGAAHSHWKVQVLDGIR